VVLEIFSSQHGDSGRCDAQLCRSLLYSEMAFDRSLAPTRVFAHFPDTQAVRRVDYELRLVVNITENSLTMI